MTSWPSPSPIMNVVSVSCTAEPVVASSIVCALAPSIEVLVIARFVQGFSGAAGVVIARAIITDMPTTMTVTIAVITQKMPRQSATCRMAPPAMGAIRRMASTIDAVLRTPVYAGGVVVSAMSFATLFAYVRSR
jgi:DHA1 family bicyclomycin/chloramphenicol resistance-like MFS transporter